MLSVLRFDPSTGAFFWSAPGKKRVVGRRAGWKLNTGYRNIVAAGFACTEHRLSFYAAGGAWPADMEVDHIDGDVSNSVPSNLRLCRHHENLQNLRGVRGTRRRDSKWEARIKVAGRPVYLGRFNTEAEAAAAHREARATLCPFSPEARA